MNHRILIALGTNVGIDNIAKAKKALKETFADVSFSQTDRKSVGRERVC